MANADRITELYRGEIGKPAGQARGRERVHWLVAQARGRAVLDIGCSQGITSMLLARAGHEVLGVDIEEERIHYALADRERKPPEVRERLEFRLADATALDLPDDSFDSVVLGEVIEHLADPGLVLAEAARVVRPDGVVALTTPFGYAPHHDHRQTFFVDSLVRTMAPFLTLDSLEIVDGYLRAVARPGPMSAERCAGLVLAAQPQLESALVEQERFLWRLGRQRKRRIARLGRQVRSLRRRLRRAQRRARRLRRRLTAQRRTRWWRLGRALGRARKPKGLLALPRNTARALRRLPPPAPPAPKPPPRIPPEPEVRELVVTADAGAGVVPGSDLRVAVPEAQPLPDGPITRPHVRVATILDRFSALGFRYEWDQVAVGPDDWRAELEREPPALLFVESAWRGNGDLWAQAVVGLGPHRESFRELVEWCRARGIPTVFWTKEDPPHFNTFLPAAALFDQVLTTDLNRVGPYQEALGHESVSVLSFGVQPRIHNPVAVPGGRSHDVGFAGTYIGHKHPGRRAQMEAILDPAREFGLEIFTRVPPGQRAKFEWPEKYAPHIVGSLPYEQMVTVYKAFRLFLNVNTVVDSPTMCARRAFEVSATATPLLSGDSVALERVFGDLIAVARDADEAREQLATLLGDPEATARRGHAAMRHVMRDHTYAKRVDRILELAGIDAPAADEGSISVLLEVDVGVDPRATLADLAGQTRAADEVILVGPEASGDALRDAAREAGLARVVTGTPGANPRQAAAAAADAATGDLLATMRADARYGRHYLEDLALAFAYTDAAVVGKPAAAPEHTYSADLDPGALIARMSAIRDAISAPGRADEAATIGIALLTACAERGARCYAADPYSFEPAAAGAVAGAADEP